MAKLKNYKVKINGIEHELQLNAEDAERLGDAAKEVTAKEAKAPANKSATPDTK